MLFEAFTYREQGYHERVRGQNLEDMAINRLMKQQRLKVHTMLSSGFAWLNLSWQWAVLYLALTWLMRMLVAAVSRQPHQFHQFYPSLNSSIIISSIKRSISSTV
jgi:hypothetical protein